MAKRTKKTPVKTAPQPAPVSRPLLLAQALVIVAATVWIYWPAMHGGWLWDDDIYVTDNPLLRTLAGLGRIWLDPAASHDYYPLDNTVWWMEWQLWGNATTGYHALNVLCHLVSALLVWRLFAKFHLRFAWLGSLLFAIHPLQVDLAAPEQYLPWPILAAVLFYFWTQRRTWGRHALLVLGFFLIMLAPVLGFVAINYRTMTWSMDHLDYLPMIGIAGMVVAGLGVIAERLPASLRIPGAVVVGLALAGLAWESHTYADIYKDKETLMTTTLKNNPLAWSANYNLGLVMLDSDRVEQAIAQFQQALKLAPYYPKAHDSLGNAFLREDRTAEALTEYQQTLDLDPDYAEAHYNYGDLLAKLGRLDEASDHYQQALKINPDLYKARYNWGNLLLRTGHVPEAIEQYRAALKTEPDYADAHDNLANALLKSGHAPEAITEYEEALKDKPNDAGMHYDLGNALYVSGRADEAINQFEQAVKLNPELAQAHYNLGYALMQSGRSAEAIEQFQETLKIHPDDVGARQNLEKLQGK